MKKNCDNCKYKGHYNSHLFCIPCKRGKFIRDNWREIKNKSFGGLNDERS